MRDGGAPTMNKLDTKRYSCDAPETAMERDVQVKKWIRGRMIVCLIRCTILL